MQHETLKIIICLFLFLSLINEVFVLDVMDSWDVRVGRDLNQTSLFIDKETEAEKGEVSYSSSLVSRKVNFKNPFIYLFIPSTRIY